jgi:heavy metal translocating P-type ATPase
MLKKIISFFGDYKHLTIVLVGVIVAVGLSLTGQKTIAHWLLSIIALASTIPILWGMWQDLRSGKYGLDVLAITAIVVSIIMREYWAGIIIVLMLTGGEALEDYAEARAKTELSSLLKQKPKLAHKLKANKTMDIKVSQVATGDKLVIYPGEVVPVDAVIIEGTSSFDESSLTGESLPLPKSDGEQILSGSINIEGAVTVRALHTAADSQYEQIIKLVRSAASAQSPFVRLADRYSIPFTLLAFAIATGAWALSGESIRFLEVLVVATPCPLLLGAPIALISGMSRAAKHGIIVKTGSALEKLAQVRTIGFDKTGTLTAGKPAVSGVKTYNGHSRDEVLGIAAALEQASRHILAEAIINAAQKEKLKIQKAKQIKETAGKGLNGRLNGKDVLVGRASLLESHNISVPKAALAGQTATYVAIQGKLAGVISFKDEIRKESADMLTELKKLRIRETLMVTGDNAVTANNIARELHIDTVYADCLPADKLRAIESVKARPVAFVGDGVNDAPVLTASDVGIALGARGSTAASESADVVVMLDDVSKVATSVAIAQRTFFIAKQSILIGIFISVGLMAIFSTGKFKPVYGAAIQELVDVTVIINALRAHGSWRKASAKQ